MNECIKWVWYSINWRENQSIFRFFSFRFVLFDTHFSSSLFHSTFFLSNFFLTFLFVLFVFITSWLIHFHDFSSWSFILVLFSKFWFWFLFCFQRSSSSSVFKVLVLGLYWKFHILVLSFFDFFVSLPLWMWRENFSKKWKSIRKYVSMTVHFIVSLFFSLLQVLLPRFLLSRFLFSLSVLSIFFQTEFFSTVCQSVHFLLLSSILKGGEKKQKGRRAKEKTSLRDKWEKEWREREKKQVMYTWKVYVCLLHEWKERERERSNTMSWWR